jgi:hypothetical protein
MAGNDQNDGRDAADERQNQPGRGLEGKGFDAGGDPDADREGARKAESGADVPRGTDEHAAGGGDGDGLRGADLDGPLGGERRDPGR